MTQKRGGLDNPSDEPFSDNVQYDEDEENHSHKDEDLVGDVSSTKFGYETLTNFDIRTNFLHPRLGVFDLTRRLGCVGMEFIPSLDYIIMMSLINLYTHKINAHDIMKERYIMRNIIQRQFRAHASITKSCLPST